MAVNDQLTKEISDEISKLSLLSLGKEDHSKAVDDIAKLYGLLNSHDKLEWEKRKFELEGIREKTKLEDEEQKRNEGYDRADNLEEMRFEHDMAVKDRDIHIEEKKIEADKENEKKKSFKDIGVMLGTGAFSLISLGISLWNYDRMNRANHIFEQTGTFSAEASRNHVRALKFPWK